MVMTRSAVSVRSIRMLIRDFERQHTPVGGRAATFVLGTLGLYVGAGLLWWLLPRPLRRSGSLSCGRSVR